MYKGFTVKVNYVNISAVNRNFYKGKYIIEGGFLWLNGRHMKYQSAVSLLFVDHIFIVYSVLTYPSLKLAVLSLKVTGNGCGH